MGPGQSRDLGLRRGKEAGIDPRRQGGGLGLRCRLPPTSDLKGRSRSELEIGGCRPPKGSCRLQRPRSLAKG